jgi:hypothetical protein
MANRLRAVFRTYTSRRSVWLLVGFWLLMHVAMVFGRGRGSEPPAGTLPIFLLANATLGLMLGLLVKTQFANPRARLLPHFAAAHLLAAGTIVVAAVLLDACLLVWAYSISGPAAAAFALALIAGNAWCFCRADPVSSRLFGILIIAVSAAPQHFAGPIQAGLSGDHPIVSAGMACFGIAILTILGVRLRGLHEEMPDYSRQIPDSIWDLTSRGAQRDRRRFEAEVIARAKTTGWLYDARFRLLLRWASTSGPIRRLLLRQLGSGTPGVFLALAQVGLVFYLLWLRPGTPGDSLEMGYAVLLSFFPVMIAMSMVGGVGLRRWPHLARESLYPLGRADFVRDLIRNSAYETGIVAAGHCAGIVAGLALFQLRAPVMAFLVPFLLLIVAQYALVGCFTLWLVSFRSFWVFILGTELAIALSAGLVAAAIFAGEAFWSPVRVAMAIALTAAAVVSLYRLTFRRWCQLDLG